MSYRFLSLGDAALTIEFGDAIDRRLLAEVAAADQALRQALVGGQLPGVVETVPTFRSLTMICDPLRSTRTRVEAAIDTALRQASPVVVAQQRRVWQLPVCYGDQLAECGPDFDGLAAACGVSAAELVRLHAGGCYEVYMLGLLPGFAFMGDLPPALACGRRSAPRTVVSAGSVAIAGRLTAIYPWESPGGWHLIGACPLPLFSPSWTQPVLLQAGDRVRLRAIDAGEFATLQAAASSMPQPQTQTARRYRPTARRESDDGAGDQPRRRPRRELRCLADGRRRRVAADRRHRQHCLQFSRRRSAASIRS